MCANMPDLENVTLEEIEAGPDPDFVPEGWLDPPPLLLRRSSSYRSTRRRRSLPVSYPQGKASKFAAPVSEQEVKEAAKGVVPSNTKKNNTWAERTFDAWVQERNRSMPLDPVPTDLLQCHHCEQVLEVLCA